MHRETLVVVKRNRDLENVQDSQMERERILSEQRDIHDCLEKKADHAFQGELAAQTKLSGAQSELDRREWRMQHVDRPLYETGMQLQSQRMGLFQADQLTDQTRKEKSWLCDDLEMRNRAFQEDRARNCQEIIELRRICCTEAERAGHLRIDELSKQKEVSKSTVNQLMVQIQKLQDKMNALNDAKELYDPETCEQNTAPNFRGHRSSCCCHFCAGGQTSYCEKCMSSVTKKPRSE